MGWKERRQRLLSSRHPAPAEVLAVTGDRRAGSRAPSARLHQIGSMPAPPPAQRNPSPEAVRLPRAGQLPAGAGESWGRCQPAKQPAARAGAVASAEAAKGAAKGPRNPGRNAQGSHARAFGPVEDAGSKGADGRKDRTVPSNVQVLGNCKEEERLVCHGLPCNLEL
eukprot:CAMPEP_0177600624 /NCGR_PEP_ID=MMETSP0419_2-20121207/13757_1 /TAXON_ID=582737 /ORGANISM="Tetraselmis sp., Strain GSL018" /LENGTH=166 /DNA_ID=CAMNT_0019093699 /DNA_START=355 /DNA_END=856 /DNA_ORIENTATION=-